jgi:hypothetical protein
MAICWLLVGWVKVALAEDDCSFKAAEGIEFNVGALKMGLQTSYHVKDLRDDSENNYTYVFNVCGYAESPDTRCTDTPAPAFQIFDNDKPEGCHRLGRVGEDYRKWSLLDEDNPTYGVALEYLGGDECTLPKMETFQRSMTIKFLCAEEWGNTPQAKVIEDQCHYELEFMTIFGCPLSCPFNNRKLCGGVGFCQMDSDTGKPRCFCNEGRGGDDCSQKLADMVHSSCNGTCVGLIFVMLLLIVLLVVGGVIWYKVNKLAKLNLRFEGLSFDSEEAVGLNIQR